MNGCGLYGSSCLMLLQRVEILMMGGGVFVRMGRILNREIGHIYSTN